MINHKKGFYLSIIKKIFFILFFIKYKKFLFKSSV
jgi:hypothetical protein